MKCLIAPVARADLEHLEPLLGVFLEEIRNSEALGEAQVDAIRVCVSFHGVRQATHGRLDREVANWVEEEQLVADTPKVSAIDPVGRQLFEDRVGKHQLRALVLDPTAIGRQIEEPEFIHQRTADFGVPFHGCVPRRHEDGSHRTQQSCHTQNATRTNDSARLIPDGVGD